MGCLCGCGGDNLHCQRPNRPPSPNTFYENFWAPNFAYMLKTRLEAVKDKLEPSKRIWWREEFGGCAPDREPLISEIWDFKKGSDRANVLRTSPPPFGDDNHGSSSRNEKRFEPSPEGQRSTSPFNTSVRSPDEAANKPLQGLTYGRVHASRSVPPYKIPENSTKDFANPWTNSTSSGHISTRTPSFPLQARPLKSPTHYVPDRLPPSKVPDFSQKYPSGAMREPPTEEENELWLQKGRRNIEAAMRRMNRHLGINIDRGDGVAGRGPRANSYFVCASKAGNEADKKRANDWTHVHDSSKSVFRGPTGRSKAKSPKSPTHYIPDRLSPLKIPNFFRKRPVRHKRKELTAEEDEQLLQSALRKLEASEMRIHHLLYGKSLEKDKLSSAKNPPSISQGDHAKEVPSNTQVKEKKPTAEEDEQVLHSCLRKLEANDMKIHQRLYGIPLQQDELVSAGSLPPAPHGDHAEEMPSDTQVNEKKTRAEDDGKPLESGLRKLEANDIETHHRPSGIPSERDKISSAESPPSTSQGIHAEDVPSIIQEKKPTEEELQQPRQSLYRKIEAMKLRRNCRQGTAIYRYGDTAGSPPSISHGDHAEEVPSYIQEKNPTEEDLQLLRQSLYRKIEAMNLRRNSRQGTAIYRYGDTATESLPSIPEVDHFADMSSMTLPTSIF